MLGPEDHVLGSDLQDGQGLQGRGDGEQSELGGQDRAIFRPFILPVKEFQPALKVQSLGREEKLSAIQKSDKEESCMEMKTSAYRVGVNRIIK